ncbi:MAG TPA: M1 family metallopeptidase [Gemmatimonadales bacterium]|nr:M1 family metallopeptidase [Gemmatimonadales bacterium]
MLTILAVLVAADTARGHSGAGGALYWQQEVAYRITASLDEASGVLAGRERITYVNRSPDTLRDFFVHQYLNAFRPGSRWAAADSAEQRDRFQHLEDPDYAFERITAATLMGQGLRPDYPYAPDSTVAHWALPRPLAPGDSMTVDIAWQARPSTVPRRQGRAGRRFDFAQWYPKVVVYDRHGWQDHPLYPAGEFYGEFATYDVSLDLPDDQVIGATGVPVEGDPGWERAKADPNLRIEYQRQWYRSPLPAPGCDGMHVAPGRKCVRFRAQDVHHFAFSLNPAFVYEEGRWGEVVVRVLYQRPNAARWGSGVAVGRTVAALAWLDSLYGKFAWPQLTNVDRIEQGGGTEFPMVIMNDSPDLGLIVHEVGHQYTMGILANNEWREAFLDEGFSSFQTAWFFERRGDAGRFFASEATVLQLDLERWSEPVATVSERFRDFFTYNRMVYTKGLLFFRQLRYVVGDETMVRILRAYYDRWKLKHVDERAFREVAEGVSRQDLAWLFGQWLHATVLVDYRLKGVARRRLSDGRWRTTVTVERKGDGRMPVEIGNRKGDTIYARATGEPEIERVEFTSAGKPGRVMLDPRVLAHDYDMLNNEERGLRWLFSGWRTRETRLDNPFSESARRDGLVRALLPVAWSNDWGGVTLGLRDRSNYLGRYDRGLFIGAVGTRADATNRIGVYGRWSNPLRHLTPRTETSLAGWALEGRAGVALSVDRSLRRHLTFGPDPHVGFDAVWMATTDLGYLDRRLWDDAGTIEAGPWVSTTVERGGAVLRARLGARAGVLYWNPGRGVVSRDRYDVEGFGRVTGDASVRAPLLLGTTLGARVFAGAYVGPSNPVRQRRIPVAGAGPYETFTNPFLRSRGALFVRPDFHYHAPGGANLRGFRSDLGGRWALAANLELDRSLLRLDGGGGMLREVALHGFVDGGLVDTLAVPSSQGRRWYTILYDGGVGLVTRHQIKDLAWTMRFELPLVVNRWDRAADFRSGDGRLAFRWQVSLEPSF